MEKKVKYLCKCGKIHKITIHWPEGVHFLSCGKRVENKKILESDKK